MALPLGTDATKVNTNWENAVVNAINANTAITIALSAELQDLTDAEIQQLQNIGAVTITVTQWGYLGAADQAIGTGDTVAFAALTLGNTGLRLLDTNASHDLIIKPGSDLTADRILTLATGDAARIITLSGNPTLADWFDQAVKAASSVIFADLTLNNDGLHVLDTNASHDLVITPGSDLTADRILTLTTGDSARTITLSGNPTLADWFDQAVKAASSPAFAGVTLNNTGLHILDTNASHDLIIAPGSDITADRTLTLTTGDSDRTITLSGNPTLDDWFDQAVKAASSVIFADVTVTGTVDLKLTTITDTDSPYTIGATANLICDTSSGVITVNLPAASGVTDRMYWIKNSGGAANNVTIDGNASETIEGSTTLTLTDAEAATIVCDGSNWHLM